MKNIVNFLLRCIIFWGFSIIHSTSFAPEKVTTINGNASGDYLGSSVSNAGDVDNDGYDDIIVGASYKNSFRGAVYVIYGGPTANIASIDLSTTTTLDPLNTGFMLTGNAANDDFGCSVSSAGDVNNDGYADIIIGAYGKNSQKGAVYVIYGGERSQLSSIDFSAGATLNSTSTGFMITGNAASDQFGFSVSSAGDINKDGYADIIVGANGKSSFRGAAYVVYGGEKASMPNIDLSVTSLDLLAAGFMITGNADSDYFGYSVSSAGDVNKDGYADVIVGASSKNSFQGAAYIIYGGDKSNMPNLDLSMVTLNPLTTGFMLTGSATYDSLGNSVSSAGDINKDGYADIIVGSPGKTNTKGVAYVIYGGEKSDMSNYDFSLSTTALDPKKTGFMITGYTTSSLGYSVSSAGDVNKDGYDDLLIGAYQRNSLAGEAYVIYGGDKSSMSSIILSSVTLDPATNGFAITPNITTTTGTTPRFGVSVSSGDINNDGFSDLLIGAWGETSSRGAMYILIYNQCPDGCETCLFQSKCQSCETGYRIESSECFACIPNCDTCQDSLTCDACSEGYSLLGGGVECDSSCPVSTHSLNQVCQDCPSECSQCTSDTVCQACNSPSVYYQSQCLVSCPVKTYLASGECFDCPSTCSKCKSDSICQECISSYTLSDTKLCVIPQPNKEVEEDKGATASAAAFEGTSIVSSSLSSGSSLPLNFGLVAKILRNVKYLDITVSSELTTTFYSWKTASGFMSAPKSWSSISESKTLPTVFNRYGLDPVFLINFWKPFVMSLIGLGIFGFFKAIEIHLKKKNNQTKGIAEKISRQIHLAASNFALTQFYCNIDDVVLYFINEVRTTEFDCAFRILSGFMAIVLLMAGGAFVGLHSIILKKYQNLKGEKTQLEAFMEKLENIKLIFKDYKDGSLFMQSFLLLNLCRSLLSSLIFATLFEYPILQIVLLLMLNVGMIVFIIAKKSFKEILSMWGQLFCEIVLLIAFICVFILAMFDQADSHPSGDIERLSKCIIVLNYVLLVGCAIILVASIAKTFYEDRKKKNTQNMSKSEPIYMQNNILASSKFSRPTSMPSLQSLGGHSTSTAAGVIGNPEYQNNPGFNRNNYQGYGTNHPNNISHYEDGNSFDNSQYPSQTEIFGDTSQMNLFPKSSFYQNQHQRVRRTRGPPQGNGMMEMNSNFNLENNFAPMMGDVASSGLPADPQYILRKRKIRKNEDMIYGRMRK